MTELIDNRTASAIDVAIQKFETPVGTLYAAQHHGRIKRCFSRDTAIRYLAYFMTSHSFARSGFKERHPDVRIDRDDIPMWHRGETTNEYLAAHERCVRRLRRILARKRDIQKWFAQWDAMHDRYVKELEELRAAKPAGIS